MLFPPLKYGDYQSHTDAFFHWKENPVDQRNYPRKIHVGVVVEKLNKSFPLPLTLTVEGKLRCFSLLPNKNSVHYDLAGGREAIDLNNALDSLGDILSKNQPITAVTFCVDAVIKLTGEGERLGNWKPSQTISLHKLSNDPDNAKWGVIIFSNGTHGKKITSGFLRRPRENISHCAIRFSSISSS
jgi:hypothetical protein